MEMKVADVIVKCLEAEGIEYAFGIVGYHYLPLFHALEKSSIKVISVKHENAAGLSALQYAKLAQKPALVLGTAGPGATNLVTGIAEIFKANLPCFILTPNVATNIQGKNSLQEDSGYGNSYSISGIMSHITKKTILCSNPQNIPEIIYDLFRYCFFGQSGPVHLLVPVNFFNQNIYFSPREPRQYRNSLNSYIEPDKIKLVAEKLKNARSPLLLIGQRAWYPNCSEIIQLISEKYQIPVVLTAGAKGLFNEHSSLFGGILDLFGHRSAELFVKQSDLIVSVGEDFGEYATIKYDPDLFINNLIQIDVDGYNTGRNYPVEIGVCGILKKSLEFLSVELEKLNTNNCCNALVFKTDFLQANSLISEESQNTSLPLKPQVIFKELSGLINDEIFILADMGKIGFFSLRYLTVNNNCYATSAANYSMAHAVAGATGGKIGLPNKIVLTICGDGSFMMNCMEIATAIQYNLPIIWMVFVDHSYGNVEWAHKLIYPSTDSYTRLFVPDLAKLAEAFSIGYYKINDIPSLLNNFSAAINSCKTENKCILIEVEFDSEESLPVKPRLVKFIQESLNEGDFSPPPYFMKAFKRMLREKV